MPKKHLKSAFLIHEKTLSDVCKVILGQNSQ